MMMMLSLCVHSIHSKIDYYNKQQAHHHHRQQTKDAKKKRSERESKRDHEIRATIKLKIIRFVALNLN